MTHIIFPIEDIEEAIILVKGEIQRYIDMGNEPKHLVYKYANEANLKFLELLRDSSKQISLNEKDIEEKANHQFGSDDYIGKNYWANGYKQALLDIQK